MQEQEQVVQKPKKSSMGSFRRNQLLFCWLWLIPPIITFAVFGFWAKVQTIIMAFQDYTGAFTLDNLKYFFEQMFSGDGTLLIGLKNTLTYFSVGLFIKFPFQMLIAYLIFKKVAGYKIWRYIFYFPAIIPNLAYCTVFKEIAKLEGVIEAVENAFGWDIVGKNLLMDPESVTFTVVIYGIWDGLGTNMLLFCGAMVRIPVETLEASRLDGVGAFREFFQIILPMMWPTLSTILLLQLTGILGASGNLLLLVGQTSSFTMKAHTLSFWMFMQVLDTKGAMTGTYEAYRLYRVCGVGLMMTLIVTPFVLFMKWLFTEKLPQVEY